MACDDAQVVRDQQQCRVVPYFFEQLQDLCLDRDIERGRRLVGNQQLGLRDQRRGQHHALAHATRQFVRISAELPLGISQADLCEHLHHALVGPRAAGKAVSHDDLAELAADTQVRVQGLRWILKHDADVPGAQAIELRLGQVPEIGAREADAAAYRGLARRKSENRERCLRFTGA